MNAFPYLNAWLQCLLRLAPPEGLIHIGAGGGCALRYPYADMPRVLAVEADGKHYTKLQEQLNGHPQCQLLQAVVAGQVGMTDYYNLSLSNESGLMPPSSLSTFWPNIKTLGVETISGTTLQVLMDQVAGGAVGYNWVVLDCLPAGELVRGAGMLPRAWDVLVVRALKDTPAPYNPNGCSLSLTDLLAELAPFGLEFVALEEENHPQMVRALFVRDQCRKFGQEKAKLIADNADLARFGAELRLESNEQSKFSAELQTALTTAVEERTRLERELQTSLTTAVEERTRLAAESQANLAIHQQDSISKLQRIQQLKAENQELANRYQMMQEELIKAETQIEFIKDLLLHEPGI